MKVLFCSPYSDSDKVIKGGINTWGRYIVNYYQSHNQSDVELIPITFDRSLLISEYSSRISRIIRGVKDQWNPLLRALNSIKTESPDVIHVCTSAGLGLLRDYLLVKKALQKNVKAAIHLHFGRIPDLHIQKNWEWKLLSKILKMCDKIIVMNRPTEKTLISEGYKQVVYLPNPLGQDVLDEICKMDGLHERISKELLFVGHVYKSKGVYELVKACALIEGTRLRIVGKYFYEVKKELERLAAIRDNGEWLTFVGEVSHAEVIREFMTADCFVFPSYSEGFPNVILEAMACGCPIVSSDVGAIPEMLDIGNNDCGVCFKAQSSNDVFQAVSFILNNEELKLKYALRAKERVNKLYTVSRVWEQLVDIWRG